MRSASEKAVSVLKWHSVEADQDLVTLGCCSPSSF